MQVTAGARRTDNEIREIAAQHLGGGSPTTAAAAPTPDTRSGAGNAGAASVPASATAVGLPARSVELIRLTDSHPLARKWFAEGGDTGPLGPALTGLLPAKSGQQYAKFAHGTIYTAPDGGVWTVLGKILERFEQLGADTGKLGLPTSNEYPVPDGKRTDFENGSLIFNELTGLVTTILRTYTDTQAGEDTISRTMPHPAPFG